MYLYTQKAYTGMTPPVCAKLKTFNVYSQYRGETIVHVNREILHSNEKELLIDTS